MTMRIQIDAGGASDVKADTVVIPITRRGESPSLPPQGSIRTRPPNGRPTVGRAGVGGLSRPGVGDRLGDLRPARRRSRSRAYFWAPAKSTNSTTNASANSVGESAGDASRAGSWTRGTRRSRRTGAHAGSATALLAEGALLGGYTFDRYKTGGSKGRGNPRLRILSASQSEGPFALRSSAKRAAASRGMPAHRARSLQ